MVNKKSSGGKKETSDKLASLASAALKGEALTKGQVKALAASVLSQDEHKGKRPK